MYSQFFILFAMIFSGYLLRKINILKGSTITGLSNFVLYFTFTCMVIYNVGTLYIDKSLLEDIGISFLVIVGLFVIYSIIAKVYIKLRNFPKPKRGLVEISMVCPNNGFMGFPIAYTFFGQTGMLFMAVHNIVFNIYIFSYGLMHITGETKKEKISDTIKGLLIVCVNPIVIGLIVGGVIGFLSIPLDNVIGTYLDTMGSMTTPLSMILIGGTLAETKILDMFKNHIVWENALMKNIILPLTTFALLYFLPINPDAKSIIILACAMPMAATVVIMASQHDKDKELASKMVFLSTALAMITLPLFLWLIQNSI